jgi:zinc/manganese transport system substrate-binding protein
VRLFVSFLVVVCAVAALALFMGRRAHAPQNGGSRLIVSATIFPLADWLSEVGGEDVDVHCLVSGNSDPHHFEPRPHDAVRVSQTRALFFVGYGLDPWALTLAKNSGRGEKLALFKTGAWIEPRKMAAAQTIGEAHNHDEEGHDHESHAGHDHGDKHDEDGSGNDPHFWHDPQRAMAVVGRMAHELGALDPAHAEAYKRRADAYIEKLKALDAELQQIAQSVPPGRQVVTFHDAYGYLLHRLNIKVAAVVQVTPGVEPSVKDVAEAIRIMKEIGQNVIFKEPQGSAAAAKQVAADLNARIETLDPMDNELSEVGKTYLERARHNIATLRKSFVPEPAGAAKDATQ